MNTTKKMFGFLMAMLLILSVFATTSVASADNPPVQGPTITADPTSPTGYTVTFVYYNPNATQVRLAGDLTLRGIGEGTTRFQPEAWQLGRYHVGGVEFLRDMTKDADGYWSVSLPLHAGGLSYWYRVWDPTQGWTNKRIWDPTGAHPRPTIDPANPIFSTPFRIRNNNDVLGAVYVPYAEKQNDRCCKPARYMSCQRIRRKEALSSISLTQLYWAVWGITLAFTCRRVMTQTAPSHIR